MRESVTEGKYAPRFFASHFACVCLGVGAAATAASSALSQETPPPCEECEPYQARYAPRPIALIAKVRQGSNFTLRLWYLEDSENAGLGVLSWNAHGEVVGTQLRYDFGSLPDVPRAFVWLPQSHYNLSARVPHDLFALAHRSETQTPSFAWDISNEGLVVGGAGARAEEAGGTARSWNLQLLPQSPTPTPANFEVDFGTGGSPDDWSMALAVTPTSAPPQLARIVGCGYGPCTAWREPFEFFIGPSAVASPMSHCEPPDSLINLPENIARRAWACDIASHLSAPVGSYDKPDMVSAPATDPCTSACAGLGCLSHCNGPMVVGSTFPCSFYRVSSSHANVVPLTDQPTGIRSSSGASHGGDSAIPILAGYHETRLSDSGSCPQVAALWTCGVTSDLRNELPSSLAQVVTGALSNPIAQRWRKLECPCSTEVVVGWHDERAGALWTTSLDPAQLGAFQAHQVSEVLVDFALPTGAPVSVEQMYDILPTGEVPALVRRRVSERDSDLFACILGVRGDITGDHAVNASDLSFLLANWGGPYEGDAPQVVADLNWDKDVNGADLGLLLAWWTPGPVRLLLPADGAESGGKAICTLLPSEACSGTGADLRVDTTRAEECLRCAIGAFGFEHPDAFAEWLSSNSMGTNEAVCV